MLFTFKWMSTFNGTAGGTAQLKDYQPIDPGSGTGGVTLLSVDYPLSDVQSGVPEPSTWALMLLGFAGLGFLAHRRRRETKLAHS